MSGRDTILAAIRANKPAARPRPDIPRFERAPERDWLEQFTTAFKTMGGTALTPAQGDPLAAIREKTAGQRRVISRVPEIAGTEDLDLTAAPSTLQDVDVAIVRAAFGIAETGSVCFTESDLGTNTLAYLAQHLVVLLDPDDIVADLHDAYARPEFAEGRYIVLHTGPSATADIEGVLIHGAQGVRSLSVLPLARQST